MNTRGRGEFLFTTFHPRLDAEHQEFRGCFRVSYFSVFILTGTDFSSARTPAGFVFGGAVFSAADKVWQRTKERQVRAGFRSVSCAAL